MSFHDPHRVRHVGPREETVTLGRPEKLVLTGLRCWIAGYETGDAGCWEIAWNEFARELGGRAAKPVVTELACFVRTLRQDCCRTLYLYPWCCGRLTRDESVALSLVADCQHGCSGSARGAAFLLLGTNMVRPAVAAADEFATALTDAGLRLARREPTLAVTAVAPPGAETAH